MIHIGETHFEWERRGVFGMIPPVFLVLFIDSLDVIPAIVNSILTFFFGAGVAIDIVIDLIQSALMLLFFQDERLALLNLDIAVPAQFDILPSFTVLYFLDRQGVFSRFLG